MRKIVGTLLVILFSFCMVMTGYTVADNKVHVTSKPMYLTFDSELLDTTITTLKPIKYGFDSNGWAWFQYKRVVGSHRVPVFYQNPNAKPVTYAQLKEFLVTTRNERTKLANPIQYDCADYTADLFNKAEKAGIESGIVLLFSPLGGNHGLNCFKTTDRGVVYMDSMWCYDNEKYPVIGEYYTVGDGGGTDPVKILVTGMGVIW